MKTFEFNGKTYARAEKAPATGSNCEVCAFKGADNCGPINAAAERAGVKDCCGTEDVDSWSHFIRVTIPTITDVFGTPRPRAVFHPFDESDPLESHESSTARALEIEHDERARPGGPRPLPGWVLKIREQHEIDRMESDARAMLGEARRRTIALHSGN